MNCFLYRLRFNTPVHFGPSDSALSLMESGDHFRADTLFSALCHTAAQLYGPAGVEKLVSLVREGKLLLSDAMPWQGDTLYLPKPCYSAQAPRELPGDKRKALKKLAWVPAHRFAEYCRCMKSGEFFSCEAPVFGHADEATRARIPEEGDTVPYPVGLFRFRENCGLFFLAMTDPETEAWLTGLVTALGLSGMGGKVSAGWGKFTAEVSTCHQAGCGWLADALAGKTGPYLLLTTSLPREEELEAALEDAAFLLVRRSGFISADDGAAPRKKQTQHFLGAGALLKNPFTGDLYTVGTAGSHPVLRYAKPLLLEVNL